MKKYFSFLLLPVFAMMMIGCAEEAPSVRVLNERPTKANVQVKPKAGNTININDVAAGQQSAFQNIAEGSCEVTAGIQNESVSPTVTFTAENDYNYTVIVANTTPATLKMNAEKK